MDSSPAVRRLTFDRGTLVLSGCDASFVHQTFPPRMWTWDGRVSAWRADAMRYAEVRGATGFSDEVGASEGVTWPKVDLPPLRVEQHAALWAWKGSGCRGVVVMPTGTGKTEVAFAAMAEVGLSTLVVAPVRDLMYQWHQRILRRLGYDAGILGDQLLSIKPVTVTTYDSAWIHMGEIGNRFGLVVFDEVHHLPGRCRREAALMCAAPMRLGLTATPERSDGLQADLDSLVGPVVYRQEVSEAAGRTLAPYEVVRIPVALTDEERRAYDEAGRIVRSYLDARRRSDPRYDWQKLCAEAGKDPAARRAQRAFHWKKSIEDRAKEKLRVLEDLFRLHAGERVIVFAGSNAMAMDVSRRFLVPTLLSHSRKRERIAVLEGFSSMQLPVLVANQVLDEGVDMPEAKVAVVIGGHGSTRQAKQRLGRILRRSRGERAVLYEVVCEETREELRSRARRKSDAYQRTRHRRI